MEDSNSFDYSGGGEDGEIKNEEEFKRAIDADQVVFEGQSYFSFSFFEYGHGYFLEKNDIEMDELLGYRKDYETIKCVMRDKSMIVAFALWYGAMDILEELFVRFGHFAAFQDWKAITGAIRSKKHPKCLDFVLRHLSPKMLGASFLCDGVDVAIQNGNMEVFCFFFDTFPLEQFVSPPSQPLLFLLDVYTVAGEYKQSEMLDYIHPKILKLLRSV